MPAGFPLDSSPMPSTCPAVVISVFNDAEALRVLLSSLIPFFAEIVVVDNHSTDDCAQICHSATIPHIVPPDEAFTRGQCWNLGAAHLQAEAILFLHVDTHLPQEAVAHLQTLWRENTCDYSCFQIRFQEPSFKFRVLEHVSNFRSRHLKIIYGDQGFCIRKSVFRAIGGFPEEPLLEDLKINQWLRPYRFQFIAETIFPSSRKFHQMGFFRYLFLIQQVLLLNLLGVSTQKLAQIYYSRPR